MSCIWGGTQTSDRMARWIMLAILLIIMTSWRAYGQTSSTTVHLSDGSDKTVTCTHQPGTQTADCSVYDSTPALWSVLKENKARNNFCKAQGIKRGTDQCSQAWDSHKAEETLKESK